MVDGLLDRGEEIGTVTDGPPSETSSRDVQPAPQIAALKETPGGQVTDLLFCQSGQLGDDGDGEHVRADIYCLVLRSEANEVIERSQGDVACPGRIGFGVFFQLATRDEALNCAHGYTQSGGGSTQTNRPAFEIGDARELASEGRGLLTGEQEFVRARVSGRFHSKAVHGVPRRVVPDAHVVGDVSEKETLSQSVADFMDVGKPGPSPWVLVLVNVDD